MLNKKEINDRSNKKIVGVSLVVLTYNPVLEKLLWTLRSAIHQTVKNYEIIIADDNSNNNYFREVEDFFIKNKFKRFKLLSNNENLGTVKNLKRALEHCSYDYVKDIGQGDLLYNDNILEDMLSFSEKNNLDLSFGYAINFRQNNSKFDISMGKMTTTWLSKYFSAYSCCFHFGRAPHGACLFFKKDSFLSYLEEIEPFTKLCEDFAARIMLVDDNTKVLRYDGFIIYYECDISSSIKKANSIIKKDCSNYINYLLNNRDGKHRQFYSKLLLVIEKYFIYKNGMINKGLEIIVSYVINPTKVFFLIKWYITRRKLKYSCENLTKCTGISINNK